MPQDEEARRAIEREVETIVQEENQSVIGWRTVPTDDKKLGESALAVKPYVRQLFIGMNDSLKDNMAFERKLYVIRKRAELAIRYAAKKAAICFTSLAYPPEKSYIKECLRQSRCVRSIPS